MLAYGSFPHLKIFGSAMKPSEGFIAYVIGFQVTCLIFFFNE